MKLYKILIPVLILAGLLLAVLYVDEKKEEQTDIQLWKKDIDEIRYIPPTKPSDTEKLSKRKFSLHKKERGVKKNPFFYVSIEGAVQKHQYEAGYMVKNLFTDMTLRRTKVFEKVDVETQKKLGIDPSASASAELYYGGKKEESFLFGKENREKNGRLILHNLTLASLDNYIAEKFYDPVFGLREKTLVNTGEAKISKFTFQSDDLNVSFDVRTVDEKNVVRTYWSKFTTKKMLINPSSGSRLEGKIAALSYDLFPDEENGQGFEVIEALTKGKDAAPAKETAVLDFLFENGKKVQIKFFIKTDINGANYYPVIRKTDDFTESPAYMKENSLRELADTVKQIKDEPEWKQN
ncbi:MAG TPA: hypothetical protein PLJ29_12125 [Leptospiraceae bacterium]|nr:hypothetical protein [Leptospiraceae bacterium]HNI27101.1 hypothetical protein [Leptospiraceae bacterium]HNI98400.1 hypothetical protein [Leptospiraceae bacterium]HNM06526.1 hypothetical protein [Leptospiraceae bacterium]HNN06846.1 hypothetical protein [Leptospiraceae bacterium]